MKATELYQKPVYSEELFQSLYPMICQTINETVMRVPYSSDHYERFDDYVQHCRFWLWQHCELYDPTRQGKDGKCSKFSTYMKLVFWSRLGAKANNLRRKAKHGICSDLTNLAQSEDNYYNNDISSLTENTEIDINFVTSLNRELTFLQQRLSPEKFNIYEDYFINGNKTIGFLTSKYPKLEYNQLKSILTELKSVHKKLVGELC